MKRERERERDRERERERESILIDIIELKIAHGLFLLF
jgi:hypothetical protein